MEAMEKISAHVGTRLQDLQQMRKKGQKIVGYIPNGYMPEELVYACGAVPVPLNRGGDPEPVAISASYLGRFMDPFCRAQIGYRVLKEEPLYQMLDLLVVPVTDIHIRAIADSWDFFTDVEVYRLGVPHMKTNHGLRYYSEGLELLKERLQKLTGVEITEKNLHKEIEGANRRRTLLRNLSLTRKTEPSPLRGRDFIRLLHQSFLADRTFLAEILESLAVEFRGLQALHSGGPRILLTGSTLAQGDYKVVDLLEEAGASIVMEEFSEGLREYWQNVGTEGDGIRALAEAYFAQKIPGAFFRGVMRERFNFLSTLTRDFKVDAVVWYSLLYRECYDVEGALFRKELEKLNIPLLQISSDYDPVEAGALRTRIETFVETLRRN